VARPLFVATCHEIAHAGPQVPRPYLRPYWLVANVIMSVHVRRHRMENPKQVHRALITMIMTSGIGCIGLSLYLWDAKPFESAPITGVITTATNEYGSKYGWRERAHGRGISWHAPRNSCRRKINFPASPRNYATGVTAARS